MADRIDFDKKRELSEIIDDSYSFIKQNFGELMLLLLVTVAPFLFVFQAITHKLAPAVEQESTFASAITILLLFAGQALLNTVVYGFLLSKMNSTPFTRDELWPFIRTHFLMMLSTISSSFIFIILGVYAMIIPGIYILVPISFVYIHRLRTGETYFSCFKYLLALVRGYWWQSFAVILISGAVITAVGALILAPHFFWGLDVKAPTTQGSIISAACLTVFYLFYSLVAVPVVMQYFNLKNRKGC